MRGRPRGQKSRRPRLAGAVTLLTASAVLGGCTGSGQPAAGTGTTRPVALRLVAFDSCPETLAGLKKEAAGLVGPYGLESPWAPLGIPAMAGLGARVADSRQGMEPGAALGAVPGAAREAAPGAPPAAPHSTTNTQEAGVDEPDLVKSDGHRLVAVTGNRLSVVDLDHRRLAGTLRLPAWAADQLLLYGNRALVLASGPAVWRRWKQPWTMRDASRLLLVDVAGAPRLLGSLSVDGMQVDARQVGASARLVLRSAPHLPFVYPGPKLTEGAAARENMRVLARSTVASWLPRYELDQGGRRSSGQLVGCTDVRHPDRYTGTSLLTVLTLDLTRPLSVENTVAIAADGDTVYATGASLYVAARLTRLGLRAIPAPGDAIAEGTTPSGAPPDSLPTIRTEVHKFDVSEPGQPRYVASGMVAGQLLNQFALSEHDGYLRVATTAEDPASCCFAAGGTDNAVIVLAQQGTKLVETGRVGGLGKGERIFGVRFLGPLGYVVTFRQTDPLYTLDLSDPRRPRAVGELKINGYSAYLHPAGDGRLIGVGEDATEAGARMGTQVSLFDVADPAHPRRLSQVRVSGAWSEVESDHHAFLFWPATGLVVLPVGQPGTGAALVVRLDGGTLREEGTVTHPAGTPVRRALLAGETLWTVSDAGVMASDPDTLDRLAWVPFSA